jgi:hypothetical protein
VTARLRCKMAPMRARDASLRATVGKNRTFGTPYVISRAETHGILQKALGSSGSGRRRGSGSRGGALSAALRDREAVLRGRGAGP